jgi:dual specificity MAP kinase phosphatase
LKQPCARLIAKSFGITHVVSACRLAPEEEKLVRPRECFRHLVVPIPDEEDAGLINWLPHAVKWIEAVYRQLPKNGVLVHYRAGKSRSTSVAIAYVMRTTGMDPDEAFDFVKWKHRRTEPKPGLSARSA